MIRCEDWRGAATDEMGRLFDAECSRWRDALGWDYGASRQMLEAGRTARHLPGFLARTDSRRVAGWTYFLLQEDTLHVGNLLADNAEVASTLVRSVMRSPEACQARRMRGFLYPCLPALEPLLAGIGCAIERHAYMRRSLRPQRGGSVRRAAGHLFGTAEPVVPAGTASFAPGRRMASAPRASSGATTTDCALRRWSASEVPQVVALLADAYQGVPQARCFAPDGRLDQWTMYVAQLVHTPGCGRFEPRFSVLAGSASGQLVGAALATTLADKVAHIAQMVVVGEYRRRGLGAALVEMACERAQAAGYEAMTLLVAESNHAARRLYERAGFVPVTTFLFADRERRGERTWLRA